MGEDKILPNTRIVVLTSYTEDTRVVAALKAGAIGYIRKEADPEILLDAIRAATRGQSLLDPTIANIVMQELLHGGKSGTNLTERERCYVS